MTVRSDVPDLYFDGQFVDAQWNNFESAVLWFEKYFKWNVARQENWKVDPACVDGKMAKLDYGTWVVTYVSDVRLPHHHVDRDGVEGHVRVCFRIHDLNTMHESLRADGVRVSSVYDGPKARYMDVWATSEGIRLTLQEDRSMPASGVHPSWVRIGVRDVNQSIRWYQAMTGMRPMERDPNDRFAVMALKLNHTEDEDSLWILEQLPEGAHINNANDHIQPICWIKSRDAFFRYHQHLKNLNVEVSEMGGFLTGGLVSFHFYDPDGNRFNVSSM